MTKGKSTHIIYIVCGSAIHKNILYYTYKNSVKVISGSSK